MHPPVCRPNSYKEIVDDAVAAVLAATQDGLGRLEVEFPAVSEVDGGCNRPPPPLTCLPASQHVLTWLLQQCWQARSQLLTVVLPSQDAGYKGSSDLYIDANIQLALAAGRRVRKALALRGHLPGLLDYGHSITLAAWLRCAVCAWRRSSCYPPPNQNQYHPIAAHSAAD